VILAVRWGVALVALAFAGCAAVRPLPPLEIDGVSAARLLEGVAARRESLSSLRARARLKAGVAGMWTRQAVLVQRPTAVRMDVLSPFGLVLAVGTQRDLLWAYSPSEEVRYEGEATPLNIARFLGAPVSVSDLVDILMGLPPARVPSGDPQLERAPDARWLVTVPMRDGEQRVWFDQRTLQPRRAEERRNGTTTFSVAFDDYRDGFPHALDVAAPLVGSSARLAYDDVETNVPLDGLLFAPPSTRRVVPLPAAAPAG
jgi:outer membrane lipoprotein-sorting protein